MREGQCIRCGKCCRWAGWFFTWVGPDFLEHLQARDPKIKIKILGAVDAEGEIPIEILIPNTCQHLVMGFDGLYACALHDSEKPEMCRNYPTDRDKLEPGCGFRFTDDEG